MVWKSNFELKFNDLCSVLAPVIEYCKAGLYGWDCMDCPEFAMNPVVVVGKCTLSVGQWHNEFYFPHQENHIQ